MTRARCTVTVAVVAAMAALARAAEPIATVVECAPDRIVFAVSGTELGGGATIAPDVNATCSTVVGAADVDKNVTVNYAECNVPVVNINLGDAGGGYWMSVEMSGQGADGKLYKFGVSCWYSNRVDVNNGGEVGVNGTVDGGSGSSISKANVVTTFMDAEGAPVTSVHINDDVTLSVALTSGSSYAAILPYECRFVSGASPGVPFVSRGCPHALPGIIDKMARASDTEYTLHFKAFQLGNEVALSVQCDLKLCMSVDQCNDTASCWGNDTVSTSTTAAPSSSTAAAATSSSTTSAPARRRRRSVGDDNEDGRAQRETVTQQLQLIDALVGSVRDSCASTAQWSPMVTVLLVCMGALLALVSACLVAVALRRSSTAAKAYSAHDVMRGAYST